MTNIFKKKINEVSHELYSTKEHKKVDPSTVELKNGMCVYLVGPSTYGKFEKEFTKEHGFKKDYHRPSDKKETDFPKPSEWNNILSEFNPDINYYNWTTKQHQFIITKLESGEFIYTQVFDTYADLDIFKKCCDTKGYVDKQWFPNTYGIEPNAGNGYFAGDVFQTVGFMNHNLIYQHQLNKVD